MPGVYLKSGRTYVAMTEAPYDREDDLQALIAMHSEILADEDAGQGQLLLVRREAPVADADDGGARWSLDHLYVDASGVPTLVEVKRSSDTRARREVVAQMLDYAANAKTSFTADTMSAWVEAAAEAAGSTGADVLLEKLGVDDPEEFWRQVGKNLDTQRFRLIFVSDSIPRELQTIIEFLNDQMTQTDVLAIEVKQYIDQAGEHQTVVPRVIGNTVASKRAKRTASTQIERATLLAQLSDRDPPEATAAEALLAWAEADPRLNIRWNTAGDIGLIRGRSALLRIWGEGTLEIKAWTLRKLDPAWDDDKRIEELMRRLEQIEGVVLARDRLKWPRTPLAPLGDPAKRNALIAVMESVISGLE